MKKFLTFLMALTAALLLASCGGGGGVPGTTGATTQLRMTPSLTAVALTAGTFSDVAKISQGVKPYYITTSDAATVGARILDDGTLRLFGLLPTSSGTSSGSGATVTIQDSNVPPKTLSLTASVQAVPQLYIQPPSTTLTLTPGSTYTFTVYGGMPPYLVDGTQLGTLPSNSPIASVSCTVPVNGACPNHQYTITAGTTTGTTSIAITDQFYVPGVSDDSIAISVTVQQPTASVALAVSPTTLTGIVGGSDSAVVMGGLPPYLVMSSNPGVATATLSGNSITVNYISAGSATINVTDSSGTSTTISVTVNAPGGGGGGSTLMVSPASGTLVGNPDGSGNPAPLTFTISGGSGSPPTYTTAVSTTGAPYITATVSGSTLTVTRVDTGLGVGGYCLPPGPSFPTAVVVQDSAGNVYAVGIGLTYAGPTTLCP
jgi:hypothetical protein